jgi:hypothetical protein
LRPFAIDIRNGARTRAVFPAKAAFTALAIQHQIP